MGDIKIIEMPRYQFSLFLIFMTLSSIGFREAALAVPLISLFMFAHGKIKHSVFILNKTLFVCLLLTLIPFSVGIIQGILHGNDTYTYFKDGFVYISILILIIYAYVMSRSSQTRKYYSAVIVFGLCAAAFYAVTSLIYYQLGWIDFSTNDTFGKTTPPLLYEVGFAFAIILINKDAVSVWLKYPLLLFLGAVILLSLERRLFLIALLSIYVYSYYTKRLLLIGALPIFLVILILTDTLLNLNIINSIRLTLVENIVEIYPSEFVEQKDVLLNWRAYEAMMGLQMWLQGGWNTILFGHGFGANIGLGLEVKLDNVIVDEVPLVHNGYIYLLVKTGIVGLTGFLSLMLFLFSKWSSSAKVSGEEDSLLPMFLLAILSLTLIASGLFGHSDIYVVFLLVLMKVFRLTNTSNERDCNRIG
jgi:hypothetical protein